MSRGCGCRLCLWRHVQGDFTPIFSRVLFLKVVELYMLTLTFLIHFGLIFIRDVRFGLRLIWGPRVGAQWLLDPVLKPPFQYVEVFIFHTPHSGPRVLHLFPGASRTLSYPTEPFCPSQGHPVFSHPQLSWGDRSHPPLPHLQRLAPPLVEKVGMAKIRRSFWNSLGVVTGDPWLSPALWPGLEGRAGCVRCEVLCKQKPGASWRELPRQRLAQLQRPKYRLSVCPHRRAPTDNNGRPLLLCPVTGHQTFFICKSLLFLLST